MENKIFSYPKLILERHLDVFGHVNNAVYLELYEEARWDFIEKGGFGLTEIMKKQIGPVILELNLKFKKELRNRDKITIVSRFVGMKNSLIMEMEQKMIKENGEVASTLDLTVGLFDLKQRKLIQPNDEWLEACGVTL